MRKVFLALFLAGCASSSTTTRVSGTGETDIHYIEIRIENHNWNLARVYARAAYSNMRHRLAMVSTNNRRVVKWRPLYPEFVLYVSFLGGRETWESRIWTDSEGCLSFVIENALVHSFVVPCYLGEEANGI